MKIGITINEVLRDFIGQFAYTYNKYIKEIDITNEDVTSFDLIKHFEFEDTNKLNRFLYLEAPLEIFGHADQLTDGLMNHFNTFLMDIADEEEHEVILISREVDKSIPSTFFFLSKTGCRASNIKFVTTYADKWNDVDVLITANPQTLESKPSGKISVKVNTSYNQDTPSDYEINSILDFIQNEDLREKILNTKITTYEELN
jgi:5'(3')-deoxyribonucleotidase